MSYAVYYGLNQEPFSNAPVTRFYYESEPHTQALMRLRYAVENMKGLALLVGHIGAGKTTLARRMLDSLPENQFEAALLVIIHSAITPHWILQRVALQLGVEKPADEKLALLSQLYKRLLQIHQEGRKAVVLIDEAQMLKSRELMEEFRGLLNLELPEKKLITFVFFGLPEIEENLKLDPPLLQRVALKCRLDGFSQESTRQYVQHRLTLAGANRNLFTPKAIAEIHEFSSGIPRIINTICDNCLLEGAILKKPVIDETVVQRVAENLSLLRGKIAANQSMAFSSPAGTGPTPGAAAAIQLAALPRIPDQAMENSLAEPIVELEIRLDEPLPLIDEVSSSLPVGTSPVVVPIKASQVTQPQANVKTVEETSENYEEIFERLTNDNSDDLDSVLNGLEEKETA
jgi:type II secretory pathway predicted ATPase ExeA